jgi:hypothetical protein
MVLIASGLIGALLYFIKPVNKLVIATSYQHTPEVAAPSTTKVVALKNEAAVVEQ